MKILKLSDADAAALAELLDEVEEFPHICDELLDMSPEKSWAAAAQSLPVGVPIILTEQDIAALSMKEYELLRDRLMKAAHTATKEALGIPDVYNAESYNTNVVSSASG